MEKPLKLMNLTSKKKHYTPAKVISPIKKIVALTILFFSCGLFSHSAEDKIQQYIDEASNFSLEGDFRKAEDTYRMALRRNPNSVPLYIALANFYIELQREIDANAVLTKGLKRLPYAADLHYLKGLIEVNNNHTAEALMSLKSAASYAPENAEYSYTYAVALKTYNNNQEAISVLEQALRYHNNDLRFNYLLSSLYLLAKEYDSARKYAEKSLMLSPNDRDTLLLLEEINKAERNPQ